MADRQVQLSDADAKVKMLLNNDLKSFCRDEGLPVTGVKSVLQQRVIGRLKDCLDSGDYSRFDELRQKLGGAPVKPPPNSTPSGLAAFASYSASGNPWSSSSHQHRYSQNGSMSSHSDGYGKLLFTESPFFSIKEQLSNIVDLPSMALNRHTVNLALTLSPEQTERLKHDPRYRVLIYCTSDPNRLKSRTDISFPGQLEIRVNGEQFQGNTRGIKKKPGTTRPADITDLVRKRPAYQNNIVVTYAATDKRFSLVVNLVLKRPVEELVEIIKKGNVITKQQVVNEMVSKANDPDVETTSTVMSLKCPISTVRMTLPCRSIICKHNQCFDATSFLQIQEQAPQWSCPSCNKTFSFGNIVIDQYVQDILQKVPKTVDQVTIEPNGTWRSGGRDEDRKSQGNGVKAKSEPTEDFVDLLSAYPDVSNPASTNTSHSFGRTPQPAREAATDASNSGRSTGEKRKFDVVDLTGDSDSDESVALPPLKRMSTSSQRGLHTPSSTTSAYPPTPPVGPSAMAYGNHHLPPYQQKPMYATGQSAYHTYRST